jgi:mannose-6-phosphate isomerase-like protein (cupin superfamily)
MEKINVQEKFSLFNDYWNPRVIAELNGQQVRAAKLKGEFFFHHHEHEDEMFLIVKGSLKMAFRDKVVVINEGEFIVVPKGVEHKPIADEEVHLLLFEPSNTLHTGNIENERTKKHLDKI